MSPQKLDKHWTQTKRLTCHPLCSMKMLTFLFASSRGNIIRSKISRVFVIVFERLIVENTKQKQNSKSQWCPFYGWQHMYAHFKWHIHAENQDDNDVLLVFLVSFEMKINFFSFSYCFLFVYSMVFWHVIQWQPIAKKESETMKKKMHDAFDQVDNLGNQMKVEKKWTERRRRNKIGIYDWNKWTEWTSFSVVIFDLLWRFRFSC